MTVRMARSWRSFRPAGFPPTRLGTCFSSVAAILLAIGTARALDINGPSGSGAFGTQVLALSSGGVAVSDPAAGNKVGAVYVYDANANLRLTLRGSIAGDQIGSCGLVELFGHLAVISPKWSGSGGNFGAVTWLDLSQSGEVVVSSSNSLVGAAAGDQPGCSLLLTPLVTRIDATHAALVSPQLTGNQGAVTWIGASTFPVGRIGAGNSLIGSTSGDRVGSDLSTRNRVLAIGGRFALVLSQNWTNAGAAGAGAITWVDSAAPPRGPVSTTNSIYGTTTNDAVGNGGAAILANGNAVVASPSWNALRGAVTWIDGAHGLVGAVSNTNSYVGLVTGDGVGETLTALPDGNYVIVSPTFDASRGAVTWASGTTATTGSPSATDSLMGTTAGDLIGGGSYVVHGVTVLADGSYVVASPAWSNGAGAVTWMAASNRSGNVSEQNSFVGDASGDRIGFGGVVSLGDSNAYAISSPYWNSGRGAVTRASGMMRGTPSSSNSLIGHAPGDLVGFGTLGFHGLTLLTNGSYVVTSPNWSDPNGNSNVGAVTWCPVTSGCTGEVAASNSLIGTSGADWVGYGPASAGTGVTALPGGHFLVASPDVSIGTMGSVGALTWMSGTQSRAMQVARANSMVGGTALDSVSESTVQLQADGDVVVFSPDWSDTGLSHSGSVALISERYPNTGWLRPDQHVRGQVANAGRRMSYDYDAVRHRLMVGRPAENLVTWRMRDDIFADAFEN